MNNIILISYLSGSSGQFLEHFLMKHAGIFNKGKTVIYETNEWDVKYYCLGNPREDIAIPIVHKSERIEKYILNNLRPNINYCIGRIFSFTNANQPESFFIPKYKKLLFKSQ